MTGQPHPDLLIVRQSATRFRAEDRADPRFYVDATLHGDVLTFEVIATRGMLRSSIRGHEFFAAMLAHFGDKTRVISAVWSDARPAFTTNLDLFNAETRRGTPKEQATFATKTGQWARAAGFSHVQYLDTTPEDLPGGYEQVLVDFVKPSVG
jgi:hypothetical protein